MAMDCHSPLPFVDFKAINRFDPDDYGRRCRVSEIGPDRHMLQVKSRAGYVPLKQAPFKTAQAAIDWAHMRYSLDGNLDL